MRALVTVQPCCCLSEVPEILAGLEADRVAGRDRDLDTGLGIASDPALAALDLKNAEAPQLDAVSRAEPGTHGFDDRLHRRRGLGARNRCETDHEVDDVGFDHFLPSGLLPAIISP